MAIFYLCDGKKCPTIACAGEGDTHQYADNRYFYSECKHTSDVSHAKNGPIKGPIDFIRRFRIHFKPYLYVEEK